MANRFVVLVLSGVAGTGVTFCNAAEGAADSAAFLMQRRADSDSDCGSHLGATCCKPKQGDAWWSCDSSLSLVCDSNDGTGQCVQCGGGSDGHGTCCNSAGSLFAGGLPDLPDRDFWCDGDAVCSRRTTACSPVESQCGKTGQRCCDNPSSRCGELAACIGRNDHSPIDSPGTCTRCGGKDQECCQEGNSCRSDGLSCIGGTCRDISEPGSCAVEVEAHCGKLGSSCQPKLKKVIDHCSNWTSPNIGQDSDLRDFYIGARTCHSGLCGGGNCGLYWPGSADGCHRSATLNSTTYGCQCKVP